jgi:hypothetical protein
VGGHESLLLKEIISVFWKAALCAALSIGWSLGEQRQEAG